MDLGWLIGVVLLVSSPLWSGRQELLEVLVRPGGYAGAGPAVPMLALVAGSNWVLAAFAAGRQADAV